MTENKTVASKESVIDFLAGLDVGQQKDSQVLVDMMTDVSGSEPVMWGSSIIGFGDMKYKTSDGKVHDWMRIGFSPRKGKLSLYVTYEADKYKQQLDAMGKHTTGKGCIYIKQLADVDTSKLKELIARAYEDSKMLHKDLNDATS